MTQILAFDTATNACSAALLINGEVRQRFQIAPRKHSELLLPMIDELFSQSNAQLMDCDAIAYGCGPGSFMGVRIATGIAQGLAYGVNIPVVPVSTLQALAQTAYMRTNEERVLAGWDARMEEIYWGAYQLDEKKIMQSVHPDSLNAPEVVKPFDNNVWFAVGNAWELYQEIIESNWQQQITVAKELIYPSAKAIAMIAATQWDQGKALPPEQARPVYLRNNIAHVK